MEEIGELIVESHDYYLLKNKISEVLQELHRQFQWFNEEELEETPRRLTQFYIDWAKKSHADFKFTTFPVRGKASLITIKNLEFASVCGHHVLPFTGKVSIAYLPFDEDMGGVYGGLSKFARAVEKFTRKPQTQEVMTQELTDYLWNHLGYSNTNGDEHLKEDSEFVANPKFLFVLVKDATHTCTTIRGPEQHNPEMGTDGMRWDSNYLSAEDVKSLREEAMRVLLG